MPLHQPNDIIISAQQNLSDCNPHIYRAVKNDKAVELKHLINLGYNVNGQGGQFAETPLILAVRLRKFELVKVLLKANADIFTTDSFGQNSLQCVFEMREDLREPYVECFVNYMIISSSIEKVVKNLIEAECSLVDIVRLHKKKFTEVFLNNKGNDITLIESEKSIDIVMKELDFDHTKVLLQFGEKLNERKKYFFNFIRRMIREDDNRELCVAECFVENIVSWKVINTNLISIVASIFEEADTEVVLMFIRYDIDIHIKDNFCTNVLANLFGNKKVDAIGLLKNRNFFVDTPTCEGLSALHLAANKSIVENVEFLLGKGANPNAMDYNGETPLFKCVTVADKLKEKTRIAVMLIQHEADVLMFDNRGRTFVSNIIKSQKTSELCKIAVAHVAITKVMGGLIDETIVDLIDNYKLLKDHYSICLKQLESLKSYDIRDRLTMFIIISKKTEILSKNVTDKDQKGIRKFMDTQNESLVLCYRRLIGNKLLKIQQLRDFKNKAVKIISQNIVALKNNYYVLMEIISYFSYAELLMFQ